MLFKPYLRDTILSIAEQGLYRPLWSTDVMEELDRNLRKRGATAQQVHHLREQMGSTFPEAEVTGYADLIDVMTNDPKDRHVLAAAIRGGAEVLVTENLKDFPASSVQPYDIEIVHQDGFLLDQLDLSPHTVHRALRTQVSRYRRPPGCVGELLDILGNDGHRCGKFADECRRLVV
ncbi:PIN domain-containing protein [Saccharothrix violaceirubra]|uniref:Putative nucleic acid-binding protein n=1 Tax=Saccharothrix violaceirubra TaxID=413306 RepID=A0A7W7WZC2_9PSEU|nr:PIN domain-containing protein [Saccharothrix violaceirubra]MBB4969424.1 putative nucleic acid-binding protein [Saccharothrix violaceirubra]